MNENKIFTTVHGSRLYGMNHAGSDEDWLEVYEKTDRERPYHDHSGSKDVIRVSLSTLLIYASSGAHQFAEAVFSPVKEWHDERFRPMIDHFVLPAAVARNKYMHLIEENCFLGFKQRRHALRLAMSLRDLTRNGRFNPRLEEHQVLAISAVAQQFYGEDLFQYALLATEI